MKYPWSSGEISEKSASKKFGYFNSEKSVFEWATSETKCVGRHPLSYLMEVCDDIAYSILDVEDAVKKELISVAELASFMGSSPDYSDDERVRDLLTQYGADRDWLNQLVMPDEDGKSVQINNKEIRDAQVDLMRSYAIGLMVSDAIEKFVELAQKNELNSLKKGIAESFRSAALIKAFKKFARLRVYKHPEVLKAELEGHKIIPALMTAFWTAIVRSEKGDQSKADEYVMSLMSPNYVRVYRQSVDLGLPDWYRQVQLVCDQVCGMTDSFAVRTYQLLREFDVVK